LPPDFEKIMIKYNVPVTSNYQSTVYVWIEFKKPAPISTFKTFRTVVDKILYATGKILHNYRTCVITEIDPGLVVQTSHACDNFYIPLVAQITITASEIQNVE
jgi:hypothetical protein